MSGIEIINKIFKMFYPELTFSVMEKDQKYFICIKDHGHFLYNPFDFERDVKFWTKNGTVIYKNFEYSSTNYFVSFLPNHKISINFVINGINGSGQDTFRYINEIKTSNW
jgi:hypothetical protein